MNKSKKIFFVAVFLFLLVLLWVVIDFAKHTKFRGSTNMIHTIQLN